MKMKFSCVEENFHVTADEAVKFFPEWVHLRWYFTPAFLSDLSPIHTPLNTLPRPRAAGEPLFRSSTRQSLSASTKIISFNRKLARRCGPAEPDCLTWPHLGGANKLPLF
ncbi:uncharacterized [Tachysurus ichikawai]